MANPTMAIGEMTIAGMKKTIMAGTTTTIPGRKTTTIPGKIGMTMTKIGTTTGITITNGIPVTAGMVMTAAMEKTAKTERTDVMVGMATTTKRSGTILTHGEAVLQARLAPRSTQ